MPKIKLNRNPGAQRIYLETSVVSYQTARSSRDVIQLARQEITHDFWSNVLPNFEVFTSPFVLAEIMSGDKEAVALRLEAVKTFQLLAAGAEITWLSRLLFKSLKFPDKARTDLFHIACAAYHGLDFLVTWNCRHIANAIIIRQVEEIIQKTGKRSPTICTPETLLEAFHEK